MKQLLRNVQVLLFMYSRPPSTSRLLTAAVSHSSYLRVWLPSIFPTLAHCDLDVNDTCFTEPSVMEHTAASIISMG